MIKQELKKIFLKRRLILLIAFILAAEAVLSAVGIRSELKTAADREVYTDLYNEFSGGMTAEKAEAIIAQKALFENAPFTAPDGYSTENMEKVSRYLTGRLGATVFFEDADYAVRTGKPIVNGAAWRVLFPKERPDLLLAAAMLVFVIITETAENETNITLIKHTSPNGRRKLYLLDTAIGLALAVLLYAAAATIRLLAVSAAFGHSEWRSPLTALSLFENSPFASLALGQGWLFTIVLGTLGLSAFTSLMFLFGRLLRSSLTTALAGLLSVILPPYILDAPFIYYFSPVSLMQSVGFLFGDVFVEGQEYGGRIVFSTAAGTGSLVVSVCIAVLLIAAAMVYCGERRKRT